MSFNSDHSQNSQSSNVPERGTLAAIIQAVQTIGPFEFEDGELEALIAEIYALRKLGMQEDDRPSAFDNNPRVL